MYGQNSVKLSLLLFLIRGFAEVLQLKAPAESYVIFRYLIFTTLSGNCITSYVGFLKDRQCMLRKCNLTNWIWGKTIKIELHTRGERRRSTQKTYKMHKKSQECYNSWGGCFLTSQGHLISKPARVLLSLWIEHWASEELVKPAQVRKVEGMSKAARGGWARLTVGLSWEIITAASEA